MNSRTHRLIEEYRLAAFQGLIATMPFKKETMHMGADYLNLAQKMAEDAVKRIEEIEA